VDRTILMKKLETCFVFN